MSGEAYTRPGNTVVDYNAITGDSVMVSVEKLDASVDYLFSNVKDATSSVKGVIKIGTTSSDAAAGDSVAALETSIYDAFAANTGGALVGLSSGRTVENKLASIVSVEDYGASTALANNAPKIQDAIDAVYAKGGGFVDFGIGTYTVASTIVLKTGVVLRGQGINGTCVALASASNCDVFKSYDFDNLTGTNKWLVSDGVPHGFGLRDMRIYGNHQGGQTPSNGCYGVRFYGKRLDVQNVLIHDCEGVGYYSECALAGGQAQWRDIPEGIVDNVTARNCNGHGIHYKGPHDGRIDHIISCENKGDGCRFEGSVANGAGADIGFIHSYANYGYGLNLISTTIRLAHGILESNHYAGLYIDSGSSKNQFALLQLFSNCSSSGSYQCEIHGGYNLFGVVRIEDRALLKGGIKVNAVKNLFGPVQIHGGYSTSYSSGTALELTNLATHTQMYGFVENFAGVGGTGLKTGSGGATSYCKLFLTINNCETCWNNVTMGSRNDLSILLYAANGQTAFTGYGPQTTDQDERWNVQGRDGSGTAMYSEVRKTYSTSTINLNITTEQTFSIPHGLFATPHIQSCEVYPNYTGTNTTWALQYCRITSVDATNINVSVKLSVAAGTALTCGFIVRAKL